MNPTHFTKTHALSLVLVTAACFLLPGCGGEKHGEVVARFKPQYDALRAEMAELAKLIPEKVTPTTTPPALDPKPEFKDAKLASNTVVVMYDQLLDPEIDLRKEQKLDFYFTNNLVKHLGWTGPSDPMSDKLKKKRASESLERELQYPLDLRYLAVVRTLKHQRAVAIDKDTFQAGAVAMGLYLVDRKTKSIVAQGLIVAKSNDQLSYRHAESSNPVSALESWANSTIWENARKATLEKFAEISGGSFQ